MLRRESDFGHALPRITLERNAGFGIRMIPLPLRLLVFVPSRPLAELPLQRPSCTDFPCLPLRPISLSRSHFPSPERSEVPRRLPDASVRDVEPWFVHQRAHTWPASQMT